MDNGTSLAVSSMPTLKADITSMPSQTVEILATPKLVIDNTSSLVVSSLPSLTVASQAFPIISGVMNCRDASYGTTIYYYNCDASDDTNLTQINSLNHAITHDVAFPAGWRLIGSSCTYGGADSNARCYLFHK